MSESAAHGGLCSGYHPLCALGDSTTIGYGLSDAHECFAERAARENGYTRTNLADKGDTSTDRLGVVEENTATLASAALNLGFYPNVYGHEPIAETVIGLLDD